VDQNINRKPIPPYVSYRTFRRFINELQIGIPSRVDRSYWGERYSGSTGTQLMTSLRFLGLIDSDGIPTTRLKQLVSSTGNQRNEVLNQIARTSFGFLSEWSLDPGTATYTQLDEAFAKTYQMKNDVKRKCIKFFLSLLSDAGVFLSPLIIKRSQAMRSRISRKRTTKEKDTGANRNPLTSSDSNLIPNQMIWYEMVLAKFPNFDPDWADEVKLKWFNAFDLLLERRWASNSEKK
jgi:hypothetical protein